MKSIPLRNKELAELKDEYKRLLVEENGLTVALACYHSRRATIESMVVHVNFHRRQREHFSDQDQAR
jgi:hypothetical protein